MGSHYTRLVPSLELHTGPAHEAGLSDGIWRERMLPHKRKKERNMHCSKHMTAPKSQQLKKYLEIIKQKLIRQPLKTVHLLTMRSCFIFFSVSSLVFSLRYLSISFCSASSFFSCSICNDSKPLLDELYQQCSKQAILWNTGLMSVQPYLLSSNTWWNRFRVFTCTRPPTSK